MLPLCRPLPTLIYSRPMSKSRVSVRIVTKDVNLYCGLCLEEGA